MSDLDVTVTDQPTASRYEARLGDDLVGLAAYELDGDTITFTHTESHIEGQGIGSALIRHALRDARERGLTVVPRCPFVSAYLRDHEEYADLT